MPQHEIRHIRILFFRADSELMDVSNDAFISIVFIEKSQSFRAVDRFSMTQVVMSYHIITILRKIPGKVKTAVLTCPVVQFPGLSGSPASGLDTGSASGGAMARLTRSMISDVGTMLGANFRPSSRLRYRSGQPWSSA